MVLDERGRYDVHFLDNFNGDRMADHLLSEKAATSWHCFDSRMIGRLANLLSLEEKLRCRTLGAWQHNQVRERKGQQPIRSSCRVCLMILSSVLCATRRPSSESAEDGCIMKIYFSQRHVNGGHDDLMSVRAHIHISQHAAAHIHNKNRHASPLARRANRLERRQARRARRGTGCAFSVCCCRFHGPATARRCRRRRRCCCCCCCCSCCCCPPCRSTRCTPRAEEHRARRGACRTARRRSEHPSNEGRACTSGTKWAKESRVRARCK